MQNHYLEKGNEDKVFINTIAGSIAGVVELCLMYPIDTVKTRMQSLNGGKNRNVLNVLTEMIKTEGVLKPWRGVEVIATIHGPVHGVYFASYEFVKYRMLNVFPESLSLSAGTAGAAATIIHDLIVNPAEVIKQRMQMENSPYKNIGDCIVKIYKNEGIPAFYKSFETQLVMNVPFQMIQFVTYEFFRKLTDSDVNSNIFIHFVNGAVAGSVAAAATTPLDVCKTLINTQQRQVSNMFGAVKTIYKINGISGFFKGTTARILHQAPSNAICWAIFESMKSIMEKIKKNF
mgnify:FL=1